MTELNMPKLIQTNSAIDSYEKSRLPAIHFTRQVLAANPEYIGENIQCLLYALYGGMEYKPEQLDENIRVYLHTTRPINKSLNTFQSDESFVIQYAKSLQQCTNIANFEPCFEQLVKALKTYLFNSTITYNGKTYDANYFKPLAYNMSGENIFTLIPYIAFVLTYLNNCSPFRFMSNFYEAEGFTFLTHLNSHLMDGYRNLAKDLNINIQSKGLTALSDIDEHYFIDLYKAILSPDAIRNVRDEYMKQTEELLTECIQKQHILTDKMVTNAFYSNIDKIYSFIIELNPISKILQKLPNWNESSTINTHELMLWTEYALAGGDKHITIKDDTTALVCYYNSDNYYELPEIIAKHPHLESNLQAINAITKQQPFCANDIMLRLITSKIQHEFKSVQADIFEGEPFKFSETCLQRNYNKIAAQLNSIYVYGMCSKYGKAANNAFAALLTNELQATEIVDLMHTTEILQKLYSNDVANAIVVPLILGMILEWLTDWCAEGKSLQNFSIYSHIINCNIKLHEREYNKLCDMCVTFTVLNDVPYPKFANSVVEAFIPELLTTKYAYMSYIKGLDDAAEVYAIGGCELYNYAHISNPYIRAYAWYITTYGFNADAYTVYKYTQTFANSDLLELIDEYKNNENELIDIIRLQVNKLFNSRKMPKLLSNYTFARNEYKLKTADEIVSNVMFTILTKFMFPKSVPSQAMQEVVRFIKINFQSNSKVTPGGVFENCIVVANMKYPISINQTSPPITIPSYNLDSRILYKPISIITPGGFRIEYIELFGNKFDTNNVIMLISDQPKKTRYQKYNLAPQSKVRMTKLKSAAIIKHQAAQVPPMHETELRMALEGNN